MAWYFIETLGQQYRNSCAAIPFSPCNFCKVICQGGQLDFGNISKNEDSAYFMLDFMLDFIFAFAKVVIHYRKGGLKGQKFFSLKILSKL